MIWDYLATECAAGRVMGPFTPLTPRGNGISSLTYPNQRARSQRRGLHSVVLAPLHVSGGRHHEGAAEGSGALLAKVDIQRAYSNVSVHPDDRWLLGMQWDSGVFIDSTLPCVRLALALYSHSGRAAESLRNACMRSSLYVSSMALPVDCNGHSLLRGLSPLQREAGRAGLPETAANPGDAHGRGVFRTQS